VATVEGVPEVLGWSQMTLDKAQEGYVLFNGVQNLAPEAIETVWWLEYALLRTAPRHEVVDLMIAKITILNDGSRNEATLAHSNNVKVRFAEDGVILNDLQYSLTWLVIDV